MQMDITSEHLEALRKRFEALPEEESALTRLEALELIEWIEERLKSDRIATRPTAAQEAQGRAAAAWKYNH
jgi:hypothetical protein